MAVFDWLVISVGYFGLVVCECVCFRMCELEMSSL